MTVAFPSPEIIDTVDSSVSGCIEVSQTMTVTDDVLTVVEVQKHLEGGRITDIQTTILGRYRLEAMG